MTSDEVNSPEEVTQYDVKCNSVDIKAVFFVT